MRICSLSNDFEGGDEPIAVMCWDVWWCSRFMALLHRHLRWGWLQSAQAQQVVSGAHKVSMQLHPLNAAKARTTKSAEALHPAKDLFDPFALSLTDPVAPVARRARIEPRGVAALDLRNVRPNALAAQKANEAPAVIALVGTQARRLQMLASLALEELTGRCRFALQRRAHADIHAQPVTVLHQGVSAEAQLRFLTRTLLGGFRFGVRGGCMCVVGAAAAAKVHPTAPIRRRWRPILRLETLLARPRLDQRAIHGQMLRGQQPLAAGDLHNRIEEALGNVLPHQPLAQAREVRLIQGGLLKTHVQEPAKQNVVIEHLAKQPIRAHRVQRDQQLTLQQSLRRNRRTARLGVERIQFAAQLLQHPIGVCLYAAKRVIDRHSRVRREVTEYLALRVSLSSHSICLPVISMASSLPGDRSMCFASGC